MYRILDVALTLAHTTLIVFIVCGWIWKRTRRTHLAATLLVCACWFGLGFFYGFGYCPLTDWQWRVKAKLGEPNIHNSFVGYHLDRLTGRSWNPLVVGYVVGAVGLAALAASITVNWKDRRRFKPHNI